MASRFEPWRENLKIYENSPRGEGLRLEFNVGSCAARNVQNNMACRDGLVSNVSVLEQYYYTVVANLGEIRANLLGGFFHVFDVCANVCQSFWFSFFPVPVLIMRIQILNTRGSRNFCVKSSSYAKVWAMARKFENSLKFITWWGSEAWISPRVLRWAQCSK